MLSNGERFRVEIARVLAEGKDITVIDEFSSVVNRSAAKIGSYAISKATRARGNKIVILSCHDDILEWIEPDWIYNTDTLSFSWRRLRRPEIKLRIFPVHRSAWQMFKHHHYLSGDILRSAQCFCGFIETVPVGFTAYIQNAGVRGLKREHRTVVLPDYQGIGIGRRMVEVVADMLLSKGYRFASTTSHPAVVQPRLKSRKWRLTQSPRHSSKSKINKSGGRLLCSFEYVGEGDVRR